MCTRKHVFLFLAGFAAAYALTKFGLYFSGLLPLQMFGILFTPHMVLGCAVISAIVAAALLWLACKESKHCVDGKTVNKPYDNRPHDNRPNF